MAKFVFLNIFIMALCCLDQSYAYEFIFSNKISRKHKTLIENDFKNLSQMSFDSTPGNTTLQVFETNDINPIFLQEWSFERIQIILHHQENLKLRLNTPNWNYDALYDLPYQNQTHATNNKSNGPSIIMSNLGTAIYLKGKEDGNLYEIGVPITIFKRKYVPVTSPRTGIIQMGDELFANKMQANRRNERALSNSLMRLSIFFHEARHSDGHAHNLGFLHVRCPIGHHLQGFYACDNTLNGSYATGAEVTLEFLKNCTACDESEKEILRLKYLEDRSRILKNSEYVDATPEGKRM